MKDPLGAFLQLRPFFVHTLPQFSLNAHVIGPGDCLALWYPVDEEHTLPNEENHEMRFDFRLAVSILFDARLHYTGTFFFHQVVLK